jgi:hypothetical protein
MTPPQPIGLQHIGAMSSSRVILGELLSSRARLRFPDQDQPATATPVRQENYSERHTGTSLTVSLRGFTPVCQAPRLAKTTINHRKQKSK